MTLPKKLEEKRDELAQYICVMPWTTLEVDDERKEYFNEGFNAACNLLLPEIKKLEEALMHSKVGFYSVSFVADSNDLKMNMINLSIHCKSQEDKIEQALKSLREFLGSEVENE